MGVLRYHSEVSRGRVYVCYCDMNIKIKSLLASYERLPLSHSDARAFFRTFTCSRERSLRPSDHTCHRLCKRCGRASPFNPVQCALQWTPCPPSPTPEPPQRRSTRLDSNENNNIGERPRENGDLQFPPCLHPKSPDFRTRSGTSAGPVASTWRRLSSLHRRGRSCMRCGTGRRLSEKLMSK